MINPGDAVGNWVTVCEVENCGYSERVDGYTWGMALEEIKRRGWGVLKCKGEYIRVCPKCSGKIEEADL